jgi:hypothetical protein
MLAEYLILIATGFIVLFVLALSFAVRPKSGEPRRPPEPSDYY